MNERLIEALGQAILLVLDHLAAKPSLERHNKVRDELRKALWEQKTSSKVIITMDGETAETYIDPWIEGDNV